MMGFSDVVPANIAREPQAVDPASDNLSLASFASSDTVSSVSTYQCESVGKRISSTKLHHTWVLNLGNDSREARIEILHSRVTGRKRVLLNGQQVFCTRKRHLSWFHKHECGAEIELRSDGNGYQISCNDPASKESANEQRIHNEHNVLAAILDDLAESDLCAGHSRLPLVTLREMDNTESDGCAEGCQESPKSRRAGELDEVPTMLRAPGSQSLASDDSTPRHLHKSPHGERSDFKMTLESNDSVQTISPQPSPRTIPENSITHNVSCLSDASTLLPGSVDDVTPVAKEHERLLKELAAKDAQLAMLKDQLQNSPAKDGARCYRKESEAQGQHNSLWPWPRRQSDAVQMLDKSLLQGNLTTENTHLVDRHLIDQLVADLSSKKEYRPSVSYGVAKNYDSKGQNRLVAELHPRSARRQVAIPVEVVENRAKSLPPVVLQRSQQRALPKPLVQRSSSQPPIAPECAFMWQKRPPSRHSKFWHADVPVTCRAPQSRIDLPMQLKPRLHILPDGGKNMKVGPWQCSLGNVGFGNRFSHPGQSPFHWPPPHSAR